MNVKAFCIAEVFVLVVGLVLAVMRSLPGPVFFPVRALAIDLHRLLPRRSHDPGHRAARVRLPGAPARGPSDRPLLLGRGSHRPRVLGLRGRGLPGRHRIGPSEPGRRRQVARAEPPGLTALRRRPAGCSPGHSAASERLHRPAEGHRAARHHRRDVEAFRQAQLDQAATFNFTPFVALALVFVVFTIPLARFVDWLTARERSRRQAGGAAMSVPPAISIRGAPTSASARLEVLRGHRSRRRASTR